eukprot:scaffold7180_cov50-Cyclotella_meneghiniana.AAC.5
MLPQPTASILGIWYTLQFTSVLTPQPVRAYNNQPTMTQQYADAAQWEHISEFFITQNPTEKL